MPQAFDDKDGLIWIDGKILPWREARIHILTHGLHYASSVFEGERVYDDNVFRLHEHSERLIKSANLIDMAMNLTADQINEITKEILEANGITNGYIRPVAWRGSEQMAIGAQLTKTHVSISCWEWGSYFDPEKREKGITLWTTPWKAPDPSTAPTESKAAGIYMTHTMSKHEAERKGFDDALMLCYRGYVAESTGANLFMIKDGVLKTPIPDCFLNGITRRSVIQIAKDLDVPVEECRIMPEDLREADEVFLTGTAAEVTAVGKIDDTEYTVGPVTRKLREAYEDLVRQKSALKPLEMAG